MAVKKQDGRLTLVNDGLQPLFELLLDVPEIFIVLSTVGHQPAHVRVGALDHTVENVGRATVTVASLQPSSQ